MASFITHPVAAVTIGRILFAGPMPKRFWITSAALSILPDADYLGFVAGVPYEAFWGHRGFTHSLVFAAVIGVVAAWLLFPGERLTRRGALIALAFCLSGASHGFLDAMTNGGLGIGFFLPFDDERWFLPCRPVEVAPLSHELVLDRWRMGMLASEAKWIWMPCGLLLIAVESVRLRMRARRPASRSPSD